MSGPATVYQTSRAPERDLRAVTTGAAGLTLGTALVLMAAPSFLARRDAVAVGLPDEPWQLVALGGGFGLSTLLALAAVTTGVGLPGSLRPPGGSLAT